MSLELLQIQYSLFYIKHTNKRTSIMWYFMTLLIYISILAFMIGYYHYSLKNYIIFFIGFLTMQILVFIVDLFFTNSLKDFLFVISLLFPVAITISFLGVLLYQAFFTLIHLTIRKLPQKSTHPQICFYISVK